MQTETRETRETRDNRETSDNKAAYGCRNLRQHPG